MSQEQHPQESAKGAGNGREANGRFAAGNMGGPGNPYGRRLAEIRRLVLAAATVEALQEILLVQIEKARQGDTAAARFVFQYALGTPRPMANPDRVEHEDWELRQSRPTAQEAADAHLHKPPVDMMNRVGEVMDAWHAEEGRTAAKPMREQAERQIAHRVERQQRRQQRRSQRQAEREARSTEPSGNGSNGQEAPLTNGSNGKDGRPECLPHTPSANGGNGKDGKAPHAPSVNGGNGKDARPEYLPHTPSANGNNGAVGSRQ
jgi:hypothetical protein